MFDWDPQKAKANQLKHGVSFEEAATAFLDEKLLRNSAGRLLKKNSEARRATNRRAEAYSDGTAERGNRAQRSI